MLLWDPGRIVTLTIVCVCVCVQVVGGAHYPATPICLVSQALHAQTLVVSVGVFNC